MAAAADRPALLTLTEGGRKLAERIALRLDGEVFFCPGSLRPTVKQLWPERKQLIFIMAAGIVLRMIAPLLEDKYRDPAVVVCDEQGEFAVSLLSGHIGGGNVLARQVADITGGLPVITTASDVLGHTALDLWARELGLTPHDRSEMTRAMSRLVDRGSLLLYGEVPPELPRDIKPTNRPEQADLIITPETNLPTDALLLHPRVLVAGIGCNRNTPEEKISLALQATCEKHGLAVAAIRNLASIDVKSDEQGLLDFARHNGYTIDFFNRDQLNRVANISSSEVVMQAVGAKGVAEPAALLSARATTLKVRKEKWTDVTVAIAQADSPWWEPGPARPIT